MLVRQLKATLNNGAKQIHLLHSRFVKGRLTCHHLKNQNAQAPMIGAPIMSAVQDDLWRQVQRRAAQGEGKTRGRYVLGKAKVDDDT